MGQVFDAECILSKRPKKVSSGAAERAGSGRAGPPDPADCCVLSAGKVRVPGEVARMVLQVSTAAASLALALASYLPTVISVVSCYMLIAAPPLE